MYDWYVLLSPVPFCMHHRYSNKSYGVVILCDTETDQKWAVNNCVEVFILCRDIHKYRFPLGSILIYR